MKPPSATLPLDSSIAPAKRCGIRPASLDQLLSIAHSSLQCRFTYLERFTHRTASAVTWQPFPEVYTRSAVCVKVALTPMLPYGTGGTPAPSSMSCIA